MRLPVSYSGNQPLRETQHTLDEGQDETQIYHTRTNPETVRTPDPACTREGPRMGTGGTRIHTRLFRPANAGTVVSQALSVSRRSKRGPTAEIELRAANSYPSLIFDLDGRDATMRLAYLIENALLPRFSWAVTRPRSGGTHVVWNLARPVHRGATARKHPLSKLARIADYYAIELGADVGYTGVLSHNPMSRPQGRGLVTTWGSRRDPYSLEELGRRHSEGLAASPDSEHGNRPELWLVRFVYEVVWITYKRRLRRVDGGAHAQPAIRAPSTRR